MLQYCRRTTLDDANLWLLHIGFGHAGAVQHGLRGALTLGLRDLGS